VRGKAPKEILDRRKPPRGGSGSPRWDWKFWSSTAIGAVGLALAVLTYEARPTISLDSPLDPDDVTTTPLVVSNDGMLALKDVNVVSFFSELLYSRSMGMRDNIGTGYTPPNQTLETGERETVNLKTFVNFAAPVAGMDLALIIYYRMEYTPFHRHRTFRFRAVRQADGKLRLQQQPAGGIYETYRKIAEGAGVNSR